MSHNIENPTLTELLERIDLSSMSDVEVVRLRAEAARAEFISNALHSLIGKIKSLFSDRKTTAAAGVSHA
ncbi:hypothetical protein [Marinobacterium rhizophilum]|uniref:Uncharacterized protein n=1 Tax=Marinobacterium rhizophilum TaxID=420402 RepID=A0ABY5HKJ0_9GAMM|nr:hypothetical protein [Marinobacterium rhizophilum]UTW11762.1 hypothetical protein KDW95_21330 [Marinobacterium rhizophilum]